MDNVYLLQHVRVDEALDEDVKVIGIYRTRSAAEAAIARLSSKPGFADQPEGFAIDEYCLDQDHWLEGFVRMAY